jgi:hypothetical protein
VNTLSLIFVLALAVAVSQSVKYAEFLRVRAYGLRDFGAAAAAGLAVSAVGWLGTPYYLAAALFCGFVLLALWLDAIVFRVFTIELGAGGAKDVVLSEFLREIVPYTRTREFFRVNWLFLFFPAAIVVLFIPDIRFLAALYFFGFWKVLLRAGAPPESAAIDYFFHPRRFPAREGFRPRPEHEPLFQSAEPSRCPRFGALAGAPVLLLSFESAARDHFLRYGGETQTPWLDSMAGNLVESRNHLGVALS